MAAMNPFDAIGTARISGAIYDRVCRLSVGYQDAADEVAIVESAIVESAIVTPSTGDDVVDRGWLAKVVELVRRTRTHAELRVGSSVRGAIDTAMVASSLARLRGGKPTESSIGLDAALVALSGRIRLREGATRTTEEIVTQLWNEIFHPPDAAEAEGANDSSGKGPAPTGANP